MKKAAIFILFLIYFTVTTGFSVSMHYCMDQFQSWELGSAQGGDCTVCGMDGEEANGCCRDEVKLLKLLEDDLDAPVATANTFFSLPGFRDPGFLFTARQPVVLQAEPHPPDRGPDDGQLIYLRNCEFRI